MLAGATAGVIVIVPGAAIACNRLRKGLVKGLEGVIVLVTLPLDSSGFAFWALATVHSKGRRRKAAVWNIFFI